MINDNKPTTNNNQQMGTFMTHQTIQAIKYIQEKIGDFSPKIAMVLGSGLGPLAERIDNPIRIDYADIPGFPECTVAGHGGALVFGLFNNTPVACLLGRTHYYEGINHDYPKIMTRVIQRLGCDTFISTNASGSFRKEVPPGSLVLINDHISFNFNNPLVGPNDDDFGPRFVGMEDIYNQELRQKIQKVAKKIDCSLHEGVYFGVLGPTFETPAEIRAYKLLGAEVIGMSTIPEVICAHHCGMKVAVIAVISNFAAGMGDEGLSHELTLKGAKLGEQQLIELLTQVIPSLN
jgi:xanthosine phosphorylase